jgi:hypothetical protein
VIAHFALGILISISLRYILHWRSSKIDYQRFIAIGFALLVLYVWLDQPISTIEANDLMQNLAGKCEKSPGACILRARLSLANNDYEEARYFIDMGLSQDDAMPGLLQIQLINNYYIDGLDSQQTSFQQWLLQYSDDIWVRHIYAEALAKADYKQAALIQYQLLSEQMPENHAIQLEIDKAIQLLS